MKFCRDEPLPKYLKIFVAPWLGLKWSETINLGLPTLILYSSSRTRAIIQSLGYVAVHKPTSSGGLCHQQKTRK